MLTSFGVHIYYNYFTGFTRQVFTMENFELTQQQVKEGYKKCINNVQDLLDSALILLEKENSHQYALGLYMYAVEEYGKAEILKDHLEDGSICSIPDWVFGEGKAARKGHDRKIGEGFKRLPAICRRLSRIIEITSDTSDVQTFVIERDGIPIGSISVPPHLTGTFEDSAHIPKRTVDFDLKAACFYVDWDMKGHWRYVVPADKDQLTDNIKRMKEVVGEEVIQ